MLSTVVYHYKHYCQGGNTDYNIFSQTYPYLSVAGMTHLVKGGLYLLFSLVLKLTSPNAIPYAQYLRLGFTKDYFYYCSFLLPAMVED